MGGRDMRPIVITHRFDDMAHGLSSDPIGGPPNLSRQASMCCLGVG